MLGDAPSPVRLPVSGAQELLRSAVAEEDEMDTVGGGGDDGYNGYATHHHPTYTRVFTILMAI